VPIKNVLASIAVKDLDSAVRWYEKLFNRPPSRPMPEFAEWSFERGGSLPACLRQLDWHAYNGFYFADISAFARLRPSRRNSGRSSIFTISRAVVIP
jgi:hypothetical protein